jgi:hypothetical protein
VRWRTVALWRKKTLDCHIKISGPEHYQNYLELVTTLFQVKKVLLELIRYHHQHKSVNTRIIPKRIHVRIEHVRQFFLR